MDEFSYPFLRTTPASPGSAQAHHKAAGAEAVNVLGTMGRFQVLRLLGQGGMGYVFEAIDTTLERPVALKVIKPNVAEKRNNLDRFIAEAKSLAAIQHHNVVTIYDVGFEGRFPFLAMELLKGQTVAERLQQIDSLPTLDAVRIVAAVCRGLQAAHDRGIVHQDIKPSNLWLDSTDKSVRILDFGLARDRRVHTTGGLNPVEGTPRYLSPEQARGDAVTFRSDLYSVGVTLYQLLTGRLPHDESTPAKQLAAIVVRRPRSVSAIDPNQPDDVSALVDRLLCKRPADRPGSASEVAETLEKIEGRLVGADAGAAEGASEFPTIEISTPPPSDDAMAQVRSRRRAIYAGVSSAACAAAAMTWGISRWSSSRGPWWSAESNGAISVPGVRPESERPMPWLPSIQLESRVFRCLPRPDGFLAVVPEVLPEVPRQTVNVTNRTGKTYLNGFAVIRFDLKSIAEERSRCVDAMLTLTLRGGISSNGRRQFQVWAINEGAFATGTPVSTWSYSQWKTVRDSKWAVDLGDWTFDNAGYRLNNLPAALRFGSSRLIQLMRSGKSSTLTLWIERTDFSNANTELEASPDQPDALPRLWVQWAHPSPGEREPPATAEPSVTQTPPRTIDGGRVDA